MIQDPSMRAAQRSGELDWLLDDLVLRVAEVRHAVVLSNDGLAVGSSTGLRREDAEHLAAVASGFHSLAKGAGRHFGAGVYARRWWRWMTAFCSSRQRATARASPSSPRSRPTSVWWLMRWRGWSSVSASTSTRRRGSPRSRPPPDDRGRAAQMTEDLAGSQWYDSEAGPLVRPYAMTGGRTKPGPTGVRFDLIALVTLDKAAPGVDEDSCSGRSTGPSSTCAARRRNPWRNSPRTRTCRWAWSGCCSAT